MWLSLRIRTHVRLKSIRKKKGEEKKDRKEEKSKKERKKETKRKEKKREEKEKKRKPRKGTGKNTILVLADPMESKDGIELIGDTKWVWFWFSLLGSVFYASVSGCAEMSDVGSFGFLNFSRRLIGN